MNKIVALLLFSGLYFSAVSQVVFEKKYSYSTTVVKLETLGYKYYLMDVPNEQCRIYNMDHSLYKTINCSVPNNFYLADIKYVSEKLFDKDAGIELVCTYYKYYSSGQFYEYQSKVINDDGSALSTIENARYMFINQTDETTFKLFAYCYDYSVFPEKVWTNIYGLPGEAPVSSKLNTKSDNDFLQAFPNPAQNTVKVQYALPENVNQGVLHLADNLGREVKQLIVDNHTDHVLLNVNEFQTGIYHYFIEYGNNRSASKKLIIE